MVAGVDGNVWTAGDNVYQSGTASEFANCYDQVWGGFKSRTRPVPGNHDWNSGNLDGYNGYFGVNATDAGRQELLQLRHPVEQLAHRQPRQRMREGDGRLRRRLAAGALAQGRPGRQQHART